MPDLAQIAQVLDYVEDHLQEAITVADMAQAVSYSLYHFCRSFNEATHHTPYDYLMRRRVSEAARALLETDRRILDIAFDYQFNSHETFSRAFKRMLGLQPSQWRRQAQADPGQQVARLMPRLTLAHLEQIDKGPYLRPVVEDRDAFEVAGVMTPLPDKASGVATRVIRALWARLIWELERFESTIAPGQYYGLVYYPAEYEAGGCMYLAATEIPTRSGSRLAPALTGTALAVKTVPAMTCARFFHKGCRRDLALTLDYIYHTWLPKSGRSLSLPWIIEGYGPVLPVTEDDTSEMALCIPVE
jgi:AraC family transcriptional regulator